MGLLEIKHKALHFSEQDFLKHVSYFFSFIPQILPLMVMQWVKGSTGFLVLPKGKACPLENGQRTDVVVLAMASCVCALEKAWNDGGVFVYHDLDLDVESWHTSDMSSVSDIEDAKWATGLFKKFYSGYTRKQLSEAEVIFNKNLFKFVQVLGLCLLV